MTAKLKGEEISLPPPQHTKYDADRLLNIAAVAGGFLAILLGVIAFIRREDLRTSGSAIAIGGAAIGFQYLGLAIGVIAVAIILGAILGELGF